MEDYKALLNNYQEMFKLFDCIHFNSSISEDVYKKNIDITNSQVIPISHKDIRDNRTQRFFENNRLHLIFIGSIAAYKGFPLLEGVLKEITYEGWSMDVWGTEGVSGGGITFNGRFTSDNLENVFKEDCLLVVPSIWMETFSLITLEALSFGCPVLVSSTVGAKDIIKEYDDWFIFQTREELKNKLEELIKDKQRLRDFNLKIINQPWNHSMEKHAQAIIELYNSIKK